MALSFFKRPFGAALLTLVAAAGLLAGGWWLGRLSLAGGLDAARRALAAEESRGNRLAADMNRLEQRLKAAGQALAACRSGGMRAELKRPLVLHSGQAVLFLGGRVVATLDGASGEPPKANIRLRLVGGKETLHRLRAGDGVNFRVKGATYHFLVRRIVGDTAVASIVRPGR